MQEEHEHLRQITPRVKTWGNAPELWATEVNCHHHHHHHCHCHHNHYAHLLLGTLMPYPWPNIDDVTRCVQTIQQILTLSIDSNSLEWVLVLLLLSLLTRRWDDSSFREISTTPHCARPALSFLRQFGNMPFKRFCHKSWMKYHCGILV